MCLYPQLALNKKYTTTKKNGGIIPPIHDLRTLYVPRGCGNCIECRKQKAREWQVRLLEDIKDNTNGKFICLTFSNQSIKHLDQQIPLFKKGKKKIGINIITPIQGYTRDNEIATRAIRLFLERWRKKYKTSLRHWLITELGHQGTENIHLHGIIWTNTELTAVERIWSYGHIWKGYLINGKLLNYVNPRTINYTIKYVTKIDQQHKCYKPIILTSPGIGANYTTSYNATKNKFQGTQTKETYTTPSGHVIAMPTYWRNKLYSDHEREQLWLQQLNKQERWICGERVDISKTEEQYFKLLQYHRQRNAQLGYGNNQINWNRLEYENQRRKIIQETRIKNAHNKKKK